jgi:hypothetical protein
MVCNPSRFSVELNARALLLYRVQCPAQHDTLFYSAFLWFSLTSIIYWLLLNFE